MKRTNDLFTKMSKSKLIAQQELFCNIAFKEIQDNYLLDSDYILNKTRKREYVWARQVGMFLVSKHAKLSLSDIARIYKKDHATVIHANKVVNNLMDISKGTAKEIKAIEEKILTKFNIFKKKKPKDDENFYFINFNNNTSVRITDNKGIIFAGFKDSDIQKILEFINVSKFETMKHKKTGHYVLEEKIK